MAFPMRDGEEKDASGQAICGRQTNVVADTSACLPLSGLALSQGILTRSRGKGFCREGSIVGMSEYSRGRPHGFEPHAT